MQHARVPRGAKSRCDLPAFNFEHRFERLAPTSSWVVASHEAAPIGAPAAQERSQPQPLAETLQGRVAIVTGGATGLGRATALELALRGVAGAVKYGGLPRSGVWA